MRLAIDFDDTIHNRQNIKKGYKMGVPIDGALNAINSLRAAGHDVYLLTASPRERWKSIHEWLEYFEFPPMFITNVKHESDYYIDNKALKFISWEQVLGEIL